MRVAAVLLAAGVARHYGWAWLPVEIRGVGSKALGALLALVLLSMLWRSAPSRPLLPVALWLAYEETQTALCSIAYAWRPWEVPAGAGICSAWIGFDLGAVGLVLIGALAWWFPVSSDRMTRQR